MRFKWILLVHISRAFLDSTWNRELGNLMVWRYVKCLSYVCDALSHSHGLYILAVEQSLVIILATAAAGVYFIVASVIAVNYHHGSYFFNRLHISLCLVFVIVVLFLVSSYSCFFFLFYLGHWPTHRFQSLLVAIRLYLFLYVFYYLDAGFNTISRRANI